ncbi:ribbon-helix-helix protein, CopG family [Halorussus limi]|uniref:Ribbon-helix-helix protein, CopG family n=1 Tax=Halorussus limi TaxID=2938695 RepID=A0A8U0HPH8_9EURY|nr:zinc ribbon domain-containing protein [Halorussus limi]UPV72860.1 ribbon-helix-helix protein, CopG family [Halorussus limi]
MSKITFRADEELVERIEARDASKSEIMREALREYLDASDRRADRGRNPERATPSDTGREDAHRESGSAASLDAVLAERVDELVTERLAAWEARNRATERPQDVNVNVTLERDARVQDDADAGRPARTSDSASDETATDSDRRADERADDRETACGQCGETLSDDHVYCPNCGEKASRRVFCECGDEVRSDWGFCPGCGRRTPAADVLDRS